MVPQTYKEVAYSGDHYYPSTVACGLNDLQQDATEEESYDNKHYEFSIKMPNMGNPNISNWFYHSNKNIGISLP